MENMQYAEELLREFLIFRGFTNTLQAFESELSSEIGRNFEVDKIIDLIFSIYIPKFQVDKLLNLLNFFKQCFTSPSETALISTLSKLELSILRYYIIFALKSAQMDKVTEVFSTYGNYLLQRRDDWLPWFAIPYIKNPSLDPQFKVYFSKEWLDTLVTSFRNFLSEIFNGTRIPDLLKISTEKISVKRLKNDIKQLNNKLSELQALLETKESELLLLKRISHVSLEKNGSNSQTKNESNFSKEIKISSNISNEASSSSIQTFSNEAKSQAEMNEEDLNFPEVKVDFQETFLGHTSPISRCRFSASGTNIASASIDGTVRIWTYDSSSPSSRNATIYCGAEIMSLDWERRSDRLLLIGTNDGGIKAWNADAKRVVADVSTSKDYPSVLDLKCSPVEPIFVSAAASKRRGSSILDTAGFASLTVWNMKTLKQMMVLPLGEDPPAITSLCFNHNGKILAASATDGLVHMFDMGAGLQITGWPAHDTAISSISFGPAETSIFTFGLDGKIIEWSLQNQGRILWSRDCNRFCGTESWNMCRHEIALDCDGKQLLVTSGLVRSPIYQVQKKMNGFRTLAHSAPITSVDWHPTRNMFITGSADHSVRVTSIL